MNGNLCELANKHGTESHLFHFVLLTTPNYKYNDLLVYHCHALLTTTKYTKLQVIHLDVSYHLRDWNTLKPKLTKKFSSSFMSTTVIWDLSRFIKSSILFIHVLTYDNRNEWSVVKFCCTVIEQLVLFESHRDYTNMFKSDQRYMRKV